MVNKITSPITPLEEVEKINELIDAKANDADVVHKANSETITGQKTFNDAPIAKNCAFLSKNTSITAGTPPQSDTAWTSIEQKDSNNKALGLLQYTYKADGSGNFQFRAYNPNDMTKYSNIRLGYTAAGNVYTECPTPSTSDNSTQIATTAYVKSNLSNYATNTDMTAATADTAGTHGLVPAPAAGKQAQFLRGDGTWQTPTNTKNTAGSTDTSSKIFLIGATSQAASPQTYSHDTAFVDTNGRLNSAAPATNANDTTVATTKWVKDQGYSSGGQATWGSVTGTLSNQTDLQTALNAKANDSDVVKLTGNQTVAGTKTFNAEIIGTLKTYQAHNGETGGLYRKMAEIVLSGSYQTVVVPFFYYKDATNVTEVGYQGKISLRVDGTAGTLGTGTTGVVLSEYPDWINNGNVLLYVLYKNNTPESNQVTCEIWSYVKNVWDGFKIIPLSYHGYGQDKWTWYNNPTGVTELPSDYSVINQKYGRMYTTSPSEDTTSSHQIDTVGARNTKLSGYVPTSRTVNAKRLTSNITLTKYDIGLDNVDNIADANKSVASAAKLTTKRTIDGVEFDGSANITHYGTCSTAAATQEKVVACSGFKLETGAIICVKFTAEANGADNPTLNVNSTGAKAIQYRGSAISKGYLRINHTYVFVYDGTYYQLIGDLDSNTTDRLQIANNIKAATAITAGRAIVGTSAGYKNIGSGITFDISYPILVAGSAISASDIGTNNFRAISSKSVRDITGNSSWTGTQYATVYLVLSALNGVTATIDSTLVTTTVPTSADNKFYVPIGYMYSTYQCYFCPQDKIYAYTNGKFQEISLQALKASQDGSGNTITSYYQPKLTSGTNIKTVNGNSLLGSGNLTVSADTSDCVKLTGNQTIAGTKTFSNIPIILKDGDMRVRYQASVYTQGTAPSSNCYGGSKITDKNNVEIGSVYTGIYTDGSISSRLIVKSPVAGATNQAVLGITCNASGSFYTEAPTPATSDNSTKIATTAFVKAQGYQTTANLVTSVSSSSTDDQYPSAKLFYDTCGNIETLINAL